MALLDTIIYGLMYRIYIILGIRDCCIYSIYASLTLPISPLFGPYYIQPTSFEGIVLSLPRKL